MNNQEKIIKSAQKLLANEPEDSILFKTNLAQKQQWGNIDLNYAVQIHEIFRTKKNIDSLHKISRTSSVKTSFVAHKYMTLLEEVLLVYDNGKDTKEFDKKVCEINDFVSSHIVKRKSHGIIKRILGVKRTTFREVGREDVHKEKKSYSQLKLKAEENFNKNSEYISKQLGD